MSLFTDSRRGIVPATVFYVYKCNAICSLFHEFLATVRGNYQSAGDAKPQLIK